MGNKLIDNLLTPPDKISVGQIWHIQDITEDVVITNVLTSKIVRIAILTPLLSVGDLHDVVLTPKDVVDEQVYAAHRIVLRMSDRPVMIEDLKFYKTTMKPYMTDRVLRSLKNTDFKYTKDRYDQIDRIIKPFDTYLAKVLKYMNGD